MTDYQPINAADAPGFKDAVISIINIDFDSAPALSFLKSYSETIKATSSYYNPFNQGLSASSEVNYYIQRSITTLSQNPVRFRHNGSSVDLEITIDDYYYVQAEPVVAPYSSSPNLPNIVEGDHYEKSSTTYIYSNIPVPPASNKIWDGRYARCVDSEGKDVDSKSYVFDVRRQIKATLEAPNAPYAVVNLGARGTTIYPPTSDPYKATFGVQTDEFIAIHYNSLGLSTAPRGKAENDLYVENSFQGIGASGKFKFTEGFVAAVLDGPYFVKWANVYRYDETQDTSNIPLEELYDCSHIIEDYDFEGDQIILLGDRCGPDFADTTGVNITQSQLSKVWGFVGEGAYNQIFEVPSEVLQVCRIVQSVIAVVKKVRASGGVVELQGASPENVVFPYEIEPPILVTVYYTNVSDSTPLYVELDLEWRVKCAPLMDGEAQFFDDFTFIDDLSFL